MKFYELVYIGTCKHRAQMYRCTHAHTELLLVHHLGPQKIAYEIGSTRMVHFMTDELDTILRVYQQKLEGRLHLLLSLG